ncbi:hypothetical protein EV426DRAFT_714416 [Tirmania nivea]|nr:hypothetical protein EV426DRAFT_714416 [Tirmania nivea]
MVLNHAQPPQQRIHLLQETVPTETAKISTIIKKLDHHDIYDFVNPLKNLKLREATAGKSVIITGASEGIGKTFFLSVRSNIKALQSTADSVKSINPAARVFTQLLDHTGISDVESLFGTVKKGSVEPAQQSFDINKWWSSVEVLLKGPYIMTRAFIQSTLDAGKKGGVIIHTSSIGRYYSVKELAAYQVGKIGLNRLSEFIRIAYLSGRFVSANWDMQKLEMKKEEIIEKALLITTARGDITPSPF